MAAQSSRWVRTRRPKLLALACVAVAALILIAVTGRDSTEVRPTWGFVVVGVFGLLAIPLICAGLRISNVGIRYRGFLRSWSANWGQIDGFVKAAHRDSQYGMHYDYVVVLYRETGTNNQCKHEMRLLQASRGSRASAERNEVDFLVALLNTELDQRRKSVVE